MAQWEQRRQAIFLAMLGHTGHDVHRASVPKHRSFFTSTHWLQDQVSLSNLRFSKETKSKRSSMFTRKLDSTANSPIAALSDQTTAEEQTQEQNPARSMHRPPHHIHTAPQK